jgi:hypothetical protein
MAPWWKMAMMRGPFGGVAEGNAGVNEPDAAGVNEPDAATKRQQALTGPQIT